MTGNGWAKHTESLYEADKMWTNWRMSPVMEDVSQTLTRSQQEKLTPFVPVDFQCPIFVHTENTNKLNITSCILFFPNLFLSYSIDNA